MRQISVIELALLDAVIAAKEAEIRAEENLDRCAAEIKRLDAEMENNYKFYVATVEQFEKDCAESVFMRERDVAWAELDAYRRALVSLNLSDADVAKVSDHLSLTERRVLDLYIPQAVTKPRAKKLAKKRPVTAKTEKPLCDMTAEEFAEHLKQKFSH